MNKTLEKVIILQLKFYFVAFVEPGSSPFLIIFLHSVTLLKSLNDVTAYTISKMISLDVERILYHSKNGSEENHNQMENNDNSEK